MARYHDIAVDIWEDLLDYSPSQKLLYIYLFSNPLCRPSGLYRLNIKTIRHYTAATDDDFNALKGKLIEYDEETCEVWVRGKLKNSLTGLKKNWNLRRSIETDLECLSSNYIKSLFVSKYEAPCKGLGRGHTNTNTNTNSINKEKGVVGGKEFEAVWLKYPSKDGRKDALRHFKATVLTAEDYAGINKALENYLKHLEVNTWKVAKNGSTWFNNWRDWVNWTEPTKQETAEQRDKRLLNEICAK